MAPTTSDRDEPQSRFFFYGGRRNGKHQAQETMAAALRAGCVIYPLYSGYLIDADLMRDLYGTAKR